jgi:hypothetical protein
MNILTIVNLIVLLIITLMFGVAVKRARKLNADWCTGIILTRTEWVIVGGLEAYLVLSSFSLLTIGLYMAPHYPLF